MVSPVLMWVDLAFLEIDCDPNRPEGRDKAGMIRLSLALLAVHASGRRILLQALTVSAEQAHENSRGSSLSPGPKSSVMSLQTCTCPAMIACGILRSLMTASQKIGQGSTGVNAAGCSRAWTGTPAGGIRFTTCMGCRLYTSIRAYLPYYSCTQGRRLCTNEEAPLRS